MRFLTAKSHEDPLNVVAFFDNSAGEGKEPDKVPELPPEYPRHKGHALGFTGGLHAGNVKECLGVWCKQYSFAIVRANGVR